MILGFGSDGENERILDGWTVVPPPVRPERDSKLLNWLSRGMGETLNVRVCGMGCG